MNANKTFPLKAVQCRVANWNSLRYEQKYDQALAVRLLDEELMEFFTSNAEVGRLDGLCDTVYVAFGVVWKLGTTDNELEDAFDRAFKFINELPNDMLVYAAYAKACVVSIEFGAPPVQMAANIILLSLAEAMDSLGLTYDEFVQAIHVVCDSNDSKKVKRVASDIKANDNDKGDTFVPPEPRLQAILNSRSNRRSH